MLPFRQPQEAPLARRDKIDKSLNVRLDELERKMFLVKLRYEKYFSGIEKLEPMRERDEIKGIIRDFVTGDPIRNSVQRFKFQQLQARWNILDLYLQRNLVMIERGTHPKFKFRADLKDRERLAMEERQKEAREELRRRAVKLRREDAAFRKIFDSYMTARQKCGQGDMEYSSVERVLKTQVRSIKARYKCNSVAFKVTIEDGKARLKAVPKR